MRKAMAAVAMCLVGGAANATLTWGTTEVYDSATGLDWAFMQDARNASFYSLANRTDGKRLATAYEVGTLFADAGVTPLSGDVGVTQMYPGDLLRLRFDWAGATTYSIGHYVDSPFVTASDTGAVGYLGQGQIVLSYGYYSASVDGSPQLYVPQNMQATVFGAALVSGPAAVFAVPEPPSVTLMALGLVAVVGRGYRSRRVSRGGSATSGWSRLNRGLTRG